MKSDVQIHTDVIQELKWDPSINHEHIGVAVMDGIVTLSGTVPSFAEKFAAEKIAKRVYGAKAVVEKIEVKLPGSLKRDDQAIAKAIIDQFTWNVQVPENDLMVSVEDGWVTMTGDVDWEFQRVAAEKCVRRLTGVRGVTNNVGIRIRDIKPDIIKQKIEEALKRAAEREAQRISVEVQGHRAILRGKVRSFSEMEAIRGAAWSAPGVIFVENHLHM